MSKYLGEHQYKSIDPHMAPHGAAASWNLPLALGDHEAREGAAPWAPWARWTTAGRRAMSGPWEAVPRCLSKLVHNS